MSNPFTLPRKKIHKVIAFLLFSFLIAPRAFLCASDGETSEYNRRATATAQILAGITPNPLDPALKRLIESEAFKEHQQWMTTSWNQVHHRIQTMETWRSHEIKIPGAQKKNLLYPFSGPDLLNAYIFFPDHARYVFFSLERPGTLPDLESVTTAQFSKLLQDVRSAFRDIFERNYFITSYMPEAGDLALISQSGAVAAGMLIRRTFILCTAEDTCNITHKFKLIILNMVEIGQLLAGL